MEELAYDKKKVKEAYDEAYTPTRKTYAAIQDERTSTLIRFQNLHKKLSKHLLPKGRLLDIACGDGIKTEVLSTLFEHTTGVDFSKSAIKQAQGFKNSKLHFLQADTEEYFPETPFNYLTSFGNSAYNQSNVKAIAEAVNSDFNRLSFVHGQMLIGTFSDFSASAPSGWFNHSREQLSKLNALFKDKGFQCYLYFPHTDLNNYLHWNFRYTAKEVIRLFTNKRRYYYIHLSKNE